MSGCEFIKCPLYEDNICTDDEEWVNKYTGEPMCKHNVNAITKIDYELDRESD